MEVKTARSAFGFAIVEATPESLSMTFHAVSGEDVEAFYDWDHPRTNLR